MKGISHCLTVVLVLTCLFACEPTDREVYSNELGRYVRFTLLINSNGEVLSAGQVNPSATLASMFEQRNINSLAIPVSLTSEPLGEDVEVRFSVRTTGTYTAFEVSPDSILRFSGTKLTDTIYLDYQERWDASVENRIHFKLESVSDTSIHLGSLNTLQTNSELTVNLNELILLYYLPATNSIEIIGEEGEQVEISIAFPNGLFVSDLDTVSLLSADYSEFAFSLERMPFNDNSQEVKYLFTLNESLDNDLYSYRSVLSLAELENYTIAGNSSFTITKPEYIPRENSLNTAANFYDLKNSTYRTYGETWMDFNFDDTCEWRAYNAFTYPVEVAANHPNAVLYDDMGTSDPEDDIFHHAFRIGFDSPNLGRTTNSFNLKRWFNNYYSDADFSPGFNIPQALEFFPDDGTSATGGRVIVIPQDILISTRISSDPDQFRTHTISIDGEGEYIDIGNGVFEISLEFRATNSDLFGGTRTAFYKIFNTSLYEDPVDLTDGCFQPMDL